MINKYWTFHRYFCCIQLLRRQDKLPDASSNVNVNTWKNLPHENHKSKKVTPMLKILEEPLLC